jgi:lipoate---protein ligase
MFINIETIMIYIETASRSPFVNLAFEEYFLKNNDLGDDIFMLWQNEPTIVVGRFQNTLEEINQAYTDSQHIHIIRRITGGGAVYHDLGNLCFTFILRNVVPELVNASRFAIPVVKALAQLGVQAEVSGRNDLTIDGKKFSGNAMALHKDRLLYHGTLLFDSDMDVLSQALKVSPDKIESKGIKSVKSRVTNIKPYASANMDILQFKEALKHLLEADPPVEYSPNAEDRAGIQALVDQKYCTWEWNFGRNPHAKIEYVRRYSGGKVAAYLEVEKGTLLSCQIRGDFLGLCDIEEVEQRLTNVRYTAADVTAALQGLDLKAHFGAITQDEVVQCIMGL